MRAAADEQAVHRRQVSQVEHRHGVQVDAVLAEGQTVAQGHGGEGEVVVAEHHALWETGGATGVEDPQQRVAAPAHILHRRVFGDQRFVGEHALRRLAVAGMDQRADGLRLLGDLERQLLEAVVDDQHGGFRVVQGIDNLLQAPADVHRIEYRVGPGHRQVVFDVALGVDRQHGDAVAADHADALQAARQAGDAVAELGEADALTQATDGDCMRALLHVAVQRLSNVHQIPPILFL
ncbi:hypothetical protein FQZ97_598800 [compost metagenome]